MPEMSSEGDPQALSSAADEADSEDDYELGGEMSCVI